MTNPLAGSNAELREAIAQALYEHWVAEDFANEYCSWGQLLGKDLWLERADAILAQLPTHPDTSGDRMRERAKYAPVDDDLIRAFIDGWNATLDHADFDMALHFWIKANCEAWPAETPKPDLRLVAPPQTEIADKP